MEYHEALNFLFGLRRFSMSPGVEATRDLLDHLGTPQDSFDAIQVAGSNGKGSTARMVDAVCQASGERVGLYTSPHLEDVRERVRVDGRPITEGAIVEFVERVKPYLVERAAAGEPLTFFETVTALSLWYFAREDVDVAVLEVGLGGEYDATSAVDPVAAAVTTVSLEHTSVLGDTIEAVARTKAKVAPADAPLVTAATGEALEVVRSVAGDVVTVGETEAASGEDLDDATAPTNGAEPDVRVAYRGRESHAESLVSVAGDGWSLDARIPLLGAYQARNAGVAIALARQVVDADEATVVRGLRSAHWPGRFEVVDREPLEIVDGAHNPGACEVSATTLREFEFDELHLAFGAMHDKDHRGMAAAFRDAASVTTCRPAVDRAEDPEVLASVFREAGVTDVEVGDSVAAAVERARDRAGPDDCVLAIGSLYVAAEARAPATRLHRPLDVPDVDAARAALRRAHVGDEAVEDVSGEATHRTVHTRVLPRQARRLEREFCSLGGDCAVSQVEVDSDPVDVVLTGTIAQFDGLLDALDGAGGGLDAVGDEIRRTLGLDHERARHDYPWEDGPSVMGILNVTPDSFHDGGEFVAREDAIAQAEAMIDAGADVVDVGGESTRPGADPVPVDEEIDRVVPVIEAIADLDVTISVDTRKAEVARAALDAGADVLNDVTGLEDPEMRFLAADRGVPVVVMHSIDAPVVAGKDVPYDDVVRDVIYELRETLFLAEKAGIPRENVIVDPGFGFGKTPSESFELLGRLGEFRALDCPILVGHSHKSMFGLVDQGPDERLPATVAATALAVQNGADLVRVHDVAENVAAVKTATASIDPGRFDDD